MCHSRVLKFLSDMPKSVGGWGFAPEPSRGAHSAPQAPIWPKMGAASNAVKRVASNAAGVGKGRRG